MNAVNLPLALFTVIVRRFIDKMRTQQGAALLKSTAPWFMDPSLVRPCMYAYMFFTGLYYTMKHMQRGTIVTLARQCSGGAASIKEKCVRRRNSVDGKKMCVIKNLLKDREGQQRALRCVTSMTPHESMIQPNPRAIATNSHENVNRDCPNFQSEINYGTNPYYEPVSRFANPRYTTGRYRRKNFDRETNVDTIMEPKSPNSFRETPEFRKPSLITSTCGDANSKTCETINIDSSPSEELPSLESLNISDNTIDFSKRPVATRKPRRQRNCLTLRGRKVMKNNINYNNNVVRKTRSGKIYGFQTVSKRQSRRKT